MAKRKLLETAIVDILYDEHDTSTYRGVDSRVGIWRKTFFTEDISSDFKQAVNWAREFAHVVMNSSSVDNFCIDGPYAMVDGTIKHVPTSERG